MVEVVERLVPDELWELFQLVVPEAPSRPQGGGRRRQRPHVVPLACVGQSPAEPFLPRRAALAVLPPRLRSQSAAGATAAAQAFAAKGCPAVTILDVTDAAG
ncbi:hypothetical protein ACIBU0_11370 [Streptomyces sp. NPDC049627]|uniref:hypothetical protein n=1 Tax=Streptomyces sp. NPDC049627 TaxID=3365595 RepID=UPI0037B5D7D4